MGEIIYNAKNDPNLHKYPSSTVTKSDDPAYSLLMDDFTTEPIPEIYRSTCYICRDPEFAQMGLPLCRKCPKCKEHIPADDTVCSDCNYDEMDGKL